MEPHGLLEEAIKFPHPLQRTTCEQAPTIVQGSPSLVTKLVCKLWKCGKIIETRLGLRVS